MEFKLSKSPLGKCCWWCHSKPHYPGVHMAAGDLAASGVGGGACCCQRSLTGGAIVAIATGAVNVAVVTPTRRTKIVKH